MLPSDTTPHLIRGWRCVRLALHFVWIGLGAALIYPCVSEARRLSLKQAWSHRILTLLAVEVDAPVIDAPPGCLVVANHISWLDIFAINAVRPAAFIAKSEVRGWPFIGWLSARNGTIFLVRGSRAHAQEINREIDALLDRAQDVAIFPEGMTTDGTHVRPFHGALLQPAIETGRPILPLSLCYCDADGRFSFAPSYAGDITLMQCFSTILASRKLIARVRAGAVIDTVGKSRRELASEAHAEISRQLGYTADPATSSGRHGT